MTLDQLRARLHALPSRQAAATLQLPVQARLLGRGPVAAVSRGSAAGGVLSQLPALCATVARQLQALEADALAQGRVVDRYVRQMQSLLGPRPVYAEPTPAEFVAGPGGVPQLVIEGAAHFCWED